MWVAVQCPRLWRRNASLGGVAPPLRAPWRCGLASHQGAGGGGMSRSGTPPARIARQPPSHPHSPYPVRRQSAPLSRTGAEAQVPREAMMDAWSDIRRGIPFRLLRGDTLLGTLAVHEAGPE